MPQFSGCTLQDSVEGRGRSRILHLYGRHGAIRQDQRCRSQTRLGTVMQGNDQLTCCVVESILFIEESACCCQSHLNAVVWFCQCRTACLMQVWTSAKCWMWFITALLLINRRLQLCGKVLWHYMYLQKDNAIIESQQIAE